MLVMRFLYFTKYGIWCIIIIESEVTKMTTYELHEIALRKVNELGLTKEHLMRLTGLSNSTITKFLKGKMVDGSICKIYDTVMKL